MAAESRTTSPEGRLRLWRKARGWLYWMVIAALLVASAWYLIRDFFPLPELATISLWMRDRQYYRAEAALRGHLLRSPHNGEATIMLATVLASRGDELGAARVLDTVPFWWPKKREMLLLEGQLLLAKDRAKEAETAWSECLRDDPLHPPSPSSSVVAEATQGLLSILQVERREDEASALVWRVYGLVGPRDQEEILRSWMRFELLEDAPATRAETLRRYLAADPRDWHARRALAEAETLLGHTQTALSLLDECLRARPDDLLARRTLLDILLREGDTRRHAAEVARSDTRTDVSWEVWTHRGAAAEQRADLEAAADAYRHAIDLNAGIAENFSRLGRIEEKLGRPDLAKANFEKASLVMEAHARCRRAFQEYTNASRKATIDAAARTDAIGQLVSACRALGWEREAEAWSIVNPNR